MNALLDQLADRRQFILYRLVLTETNELDKIPTHPATGENVNAQDRAQWMPPAEAALWAGQWNAAKPPGVAGYGVGLVITDDCGIACLDLDDCRDPNGGWFPHVVAFEAMFPGAARETSVSGAGRHVFIPYRGTLPAHGTNNATYRMQCYTRRRFIAVTGLDADGSVEGDFTTALTAFLVQYFPPPVDAERGAEWTSGPVAAWSGPVDDGELIQRALRIVSPRAAFGGRASFADLWSANADVLARAFPPQSAHQTWDNSAADMALASHLAWLTGNDCERIERMMRASGLVRAKYDRPGYMRGTILRACATQTECYKDPRPNAAAVPLPPTESVVPSPPTVPAPPTAAVPVEGAPYNLTIKRINGRDQYEATLPNLVHMLGEQQRTRIGFDTFRHRIMISPAGTEQWRPLTDVDMVKLRERFSRVEGFAAVPKDLMHDALQLVADRYRFDSAITWLNGLTWDGVPRVAKFLTSYCGSADDDYSQAVSHYIWTALAARVLEPGCQVDMVVALLSPQGMRKSTGLRAIAPDPEFFTDGLELHQDDDNFKRLLRGKLVVEIAELAGLSKADVTLVKRVITRRDEEWIEKYATQPTRFARRCLMFATTNEPEFLPKDETGQRRWLPVEVVRIDPERIAGDRLQLWAEGATMYQRLRAAGLPGVLYEEAERLAAGRHPLYEQTDVWDSAIEDWLTTPPQVPEGFPPLPAPGTRPLTISHVLTCALLMDKDRMDKRAEMRVAGALRRFGYEKRKMRIDGTPCERWVRKA